MKIPHLTLGMAVMATTAIANAATPNELDIVETASKAGQFETLVAAVQAGGLEETLRQPGPYTVFAPSDAAFAKLPAGTVENLLKPENRDQLVGVLTYHVVPGKFPASQVVTSAGVPTANGQMINFGRNPAGQVTVDGAMIVKTDIPCANGVIHVIDTVILPASDNLVVTASRTGKFNTLLAAAKAAGLDATLANDGPYTIFAPTDDAFSKLGNEKIAELLLPENKELLIAILKHHVVKGRVYSADAVSKGSAKTLQGTQLPIKVDKSGASVGNAKIIMTDVDASNGVVHVVDSVLIPN